MFEDGRRDEALGLARRILAADADRDALDCCAWLFSNCRHYDEAASAYRRLIALDPGWIDGYRHLSGALAAAGAAEAAIAAAITASDLAPACSEYARHAGFLLLEAGRAGEAASRLRRALAADPADAAALRALSAALAAQGDGAAALALACDAAGRAPRDAATAIHAAELLLRAGRLDEAAALLDRLTAAAPNAAAWRVLSGIEISRERPGAALAAIEAAIGLAPANGEYHLHRGHVLYRLGAADAAADAFAEATRRGAGSSEARRAQLAAFVAGGRLGEATALGGTLLREFPDDEAAATAVLDLLSRRLDGGAEPTVAAARKEQRLPRRAQRFGDALACQGRVLHALILREARTRFGEARLGYGWAVIEPLVHLALLFVMFAVVMRGRPPLGSQFFVFYYTGLLPYQIFTHAAGAMTHGIAGNGALLHLPKVTPGDVVLARFLVEFITDVVVAALLFAVFAACGLAGWPDDPSGPCLAVLAAAALGCGVGFVNAAMQVQFRSWDKIWVQIARGLYFASGIFYLPGAMPGWARDILAWNPLLQAIAWFRAGYFAAYRPVWLDRSYLVAAALLAVLAGLAAERLLRRRLAEPP